MPWTVIIVIPVHDIYAIGNNCLPVNKEEESWKNQIRFQSTVLSPSITHSFYCTRVALHSMDILFMSFRHRRDLAVTLNRL